MQHQANELVYSTVWDNPTPATYGQGSGAIVMQVWTRSHTQPHTHKSMHARANIPARVLSIDGTPLQQFKKCIIRGDVLIRCLQHSDGKEIFFLSFHTSFVTDDQVPCSPSRAAVRSLR